MADLGQNVCANGVALQQLSLGRVYLGAGRCLEQGAQYQVDLDREQGSEMWIHHRCLLVQGYQFAQVGYDLGGRNTRQQLQIAFVGPLARILGGTPPVLIECRLGEDLVVARGRSPAVPVEQQTREIICIWILMRYHNSAFYLLISDPMRPDVRRWA